MYDKKIRVTVDSVLGYEQFFDRGHPLADSKGRVWYHRHVMSIHLGRWLSAKEVVHHKDGNRRNNDIDNLILFKCVREHGWEHEGKRPTAHCRLCGKKFKTSTDKSEFCSNECRGKGSRKFSVTKKELERLIRSIPMVRIGEMFGVSDKAIVKRCVRLGVDLSVRRNARRKKHPASTTESASVSEAEYRGSIPRRGASYGSVV